MYKVVILTPWFPNYPGDREGAYIFESAAALSRAGASVAILVCRPHVPAVRPLRRGNNRLGVLENVVSVRHLRFPGDSLRPLTNALERAAVIPELLKLVTNHRASLIHAQTEGMAPLAQEVADILNIPAVATIHGINTNTKFMHSAGQRARLVPALQGMRRLILVGQPIHEFFACYVGRDDYIRVVPNGVSSLFRPSREAIFSEDTVKLVSVSNLHKSKGIEIALQALSILDRQGLNGWTYSIVGDGEQRKSLERLAKLLNLEPRTSFFGNLPPSRVLDRLQRSDIFLLPSYNEAFGIAYLEAMSCGLVTIGVRGQGPEAFIEDGVTGYLVETQNAQSVADCLEQILRNRQSARVMGKRAAEAAQAFTWDEHARQLLSVYQEAIAA